MTYFSHKGSVLVEGVLVLSLISITLGFLFSSLRLHQDVVLNRIQNDRATYIMTGVMEQIRSARDSAVNASRTHGWNRFIQPIQNAMAPNGKAALMIARSDGSNGYAESQLYLEKYDDKKSFIESHISPYTQYKILIKAWFENHDTQAVRFSVIVSWEKNDDQQWVQEAEWDAAGKDAIMQDLLLTHYRLQEHVF